MRLTAVSRREGVDAYVPATRPRLSKPVSSSPSIACLCVSTRAEGVLVFANGAKEEGWNPVTKMFGVQVYSKSAGESGRMMCKGQTTMPAEVTMQLIEDQFVRAFNNNKTLPMQMRASGTLERGGQGLCMLVRCMSILLDQIRRRWNRLEMHQFLFLMDFAVSQRSKPSA